jgi:hypothetical protein
MVGNSNSLQPFNMGRQRQTNEKNSINDEYLALTVSSTPISPVSDTNKHVPFDVRPEPSSKTIQVNSARLEPTPVKKFKQVAGESTVKKILKEVRIGDTQLYKVMSGDEHGEKVCLIL